jgi:type IX secretion system PorP/SprF family membrane protein
MRVRGSLEIIQPCQAHQRSRTTLNSRLRRTMVASITGVLLVLSAAAQDIHFSQFFNTPLALGPAMTGGFDGQHRFNAIHRQQWRAVTVPYSTFGLGWDQRDAFRTRGLGVGVWCFNDRAGDSRMNTFHLSAAASWRQPLDASGDHSITAGMQAGGSSRSIDRTGLSFDAQYNGFTFDPQQPTGERFDRDAFWHADVHAGLRYHWRRNERSEVQVGVTMFNLSGPRIGYLGGPGEPLDRRLDLHVLTAFTAGSSLDLLPSLRYLHQGTFREFDIGADVRHTLLHRHGLHRALRVGLYLRARDAGYAHAALEYDDWTVGLSYDLNTSRLVPASRNRGGVELSAIYILRRRPAIPTRYISCPDQR